MTNSKWQVNSQLSQQRGKLAWITEIIKPVTTKSIIRPNCNYMGLYPLFLSHNQSQETPSPLRLKHVYIC